MPVVLATVGFALNFWAWALLTPLGMDPPLWHRSDGAAGVLLLAIPLIIGAVGRVPVGALTDRYGVRTMFPAVDAVAAVGVLAVASARSLPALLVAACALGVAGTAFAVGAPLVTRAYPVGRRALVLSVFGAGSGAVCGASLTSRWSPHLDSSWVLFSLAGMLSAHAVVAATVVHDVVPGSRRADPVWRSITMVWRLPATRHLAGWYAVSCGGLFALGLYLPAGAHGSYGLDWSRATLIGAWAMACGALTRPVGGLLCQRRDPVLVLTWCYGAVATLSLALAFRPPPVAATVMAFGLATCLGAASGVVLALIGRTAPTERIGAITGIVGAAGALATLAPALLLGVVYGMTTSHGIGLTVLAGVAVAAVARLRGEGRWSGALLAYPAPPPLDRSGTTVVALTADDAGRDIQGIISALAALAGRRDVVIAYGHRNTSAGPTPHALVSQLRTHLPHHTIIAACVDTPPRRCERELLADLLHDGCLTVAAVRPADVDAVATVLAEQLEADALQHLTHNRVHGVRLRTPAPAGAGNC